MQPKRLFIIDAMAMAFRNFHAFGVRPLTTSDGTPVSAVFGSAIFMSKLIEEEKPDCIVVATDSKEPTFRHELYKAYKANRTEMPEDLAKQLPLFFELFAALGIPVIKQSGVEADDLIGSIVTRFGSKNLNCYIVSGDKDFMQLIDGDTFLYAPKKNEPAQIIDVNGVLGKFNCKPNQVIDVLALMGDSSDNVPGVKGIGEKGAAKLIQEYHSLENLYENVDKVANEKLKNALIANKENAFLSKKLVTIKTDVELKISMDDLGCNHQNTLLRDELLEFYKKVEFKSLVAKTLDARKSLGIAESRPAAPAFSLNTDEVQYTLVNTAAKFDEAFRALVAAPAFAVDTETTGLDIIQSMPIGIAFSVRARQGFYIPLVNKHLEDIQPQTIVDRLRKILQSPSKLKIGHNLKFDLQMLHNVGLEVAQPISDTMIESYVLDASARDHSLDSCSLRFLQYKKIPTTELMGEKYEKSMLDADLNLLTRYACEDVDITFRLHEYFKPKVTELHVEKVLDEIDLPLVPVLSHMEQQGIHVDADALMELSIKQDKRIKELEHEIHTLAGKEFNINSPKQLQVVLFDELKIQDQVAGVRLKKTKSGYSTDVSVLEQLSEHPIAHALLEYRTLTKLKGTYVDTLPQLINPKSHRLHTSFHQTGTTTGRLSSSDPNLQNIPIRKEEGREIRKAFSAKSDDYVIISADYSQVELRILAHIADEEALRQAFQEKQDIHRATASRIFNVPLAEVNSELRSRAKAINFGIIYGMGPMRLARTTGVSMAEAKSFIEKYFAGYPKIEKYIDSSIAFAKEHGFCKTMTGRIRPLPEIHSRDRMALVNAENIAVNTPIQGSAADLIKLAMIKINEEIQSQGLDLNMLLQVHDELVFECHKKDVAAACALIKNCMENAMHLTVPLEVEVGTGSNWLEAH